MTEATFDTFTQLQQGQETTLYHQELNPPDISRTCILEIRWTHDRIEGDLMFGSMEIPGLGTLGRDAYAYRVSDGSSQQPVWLASVDFRKALTSPEPLVLKRLTGGPLHTTQLLPSEISTRAGPKPNLSRQSSIPRVVSFSRDEHAAILGWQGGLREKGFESSFPHESYIEYQRCLGHSLASVVKRGGLESSIDVRRERKSFFTSTYSIWANDHSFRSAAYNPGVTHAEPRGTTYFAERCGTFPELLCLMDRAVDTLVQRNQPKYQ